MSNWQPIATAPLNTPVLVYDAVRRRNNAGVCGGIVGHVDMDPHIYVAVQRLNYYDKATEWLSDLVQFETGWESTGSYTLTVNLQPTHWQPLPEPPV